MENSTDNSIVDEFKKAFNRATTNSSAKNVQIETGYQFRQQTIGLFNIMYAQAQQRESEEQYMFNQTIKAETISGNQVCIRPLTDLRSITISNLKVNQINYGCKLEATIITKPFQIIGCNMIIEDSQNNVLIFSLYNYFALYQKLKTLALALPIGTKIIIKELYCKKSAGGSLAIRIDNPHSNLVIIDPFQNTIDKTIRTCHDSELLKQKGNDLVRQKLYKNAIRYYSAAIKVGGISVELLMKLLSNRMLCLIKLKQFKQAITDGTDVLTLGARAAMDTKIRFRLASALTGIGRYLESQLMLGEIRNGNSSSFVNGIDQLYSRNCRNFNESINNDIEYDYSNIDWKDIADFHGDIEIKYMNKVKGRGIVATNNMKCGERLLMEKCIVFGLKDKKHFALSVNKTKNIASKSDQISLRHNMVHIYMNGNVADRYRISLLHAGSEFSKNKNKNNVPSMDVFRYYELPENVSQSDVKLLSVSQLDDIVTKNSFAMPDEGGCALFGVGSFFNHNDDANADWHVFRRRIYVTLTRNVRKGEEICIKYHEKGVGNWLD